MNSKTVSALIDKLSDKELTFGCKVKVGDYERYIVNLYQETNGFNKSYKFSDHIIYTEEQIKFDKGIIVLGHPVLIGTVLAKIKDKLYSWIDPDEDPPHENVIDEFIRLWQPCGLDKSLQEIAGCGYEEIRHMAGGGGTVNWYEEQLSDPSARALFEFLTTIFNV